MATANRRRLCFKNICAAAFFLLFHAGAPLDAALAASGNGARAEALFHEAREKAAAGNLDEACPLFEASHRLEPAGGTLLNLAVCHERQGKTATAWREFHAARDMARKDRRADREKLAREHIDKLSPRLSWLTIALTPGARVPGLKVTRNGVLIPPSDYDSTLPVDPGEFVLVATAPAMQPWQTRLSVRGEGTRLRVAVPALRPTPADLPMRPQHIAGIALGAAGLLSTGLGIFYGTSAVAQNRAARSRCSDTTCPDSASLALSQDARRSATIANITIGAGLAALGGGAVLFLTGGHPAASGADQATLPRPWFVAPVVAEAGGGVVLGGAL